MTEHWHIVSIISEQAAIFNWKWPLLELFEHFWGHVGGGGGGGGGGEMVWRRRGELGTMHQTITVFLC